MSGAQVTIQIDDAELRRALRRMLGDLANPAPAMREIGEVVRNSTRAQWPHLWGDIPARPFLGLSAADGDEVVTILRDHLAR